jgi:hypothetical protein
LSIVLIIGAVALAEDAWQLAEQATEDQARLVRLHKRVAPKVQAKPSRNELDEQKRWAALDAVNWSSASQSGVFLCPLGKLNF